MSISNRMRACWSSHIAIVIALCGLAMDGVAQPPAAASGLQHQRDAFRIAYTAAQNGQDWQPLARGLETYPLYPYLEATALQHDIQIAPRKEVDAYLQRYAGMIPAGELRKTELRWLADQGDWAGFRHFYRTGLGDTLTCDDLQAKLAQGKQLDFERDLAALWRQPGLPSACTPVLEAAHTQGLLTTARVWARIEHTADAGNADTIDESAAWLTGNDAAAAQRIAAAVRSPGNFLKKAADLPDTPHDREAVCRALIAFARIDSAQALAFWQSLSKRFKFDKVRRGQILTALALYNAVDGGPGAVQRLAALPASEQTDATREWRVRAAIAQSDWKAAATALAALTPEEMQHDEWRYWRARVAQKLGHAATALDDYTTLAQQATFYGFLAADRADLPYSICPRTVAPDPALDGQIRAIPGLARAFEFFALDMLPQARREWNRAFPDLTPEQQTHAAALASQEGWYDRTIFAFGKSGDLHYYTLRFPLADKTRVLKASRDAGIDPAWAFAIIRAETAWQSDAQSGANARGLMQLRPGTAKRVARRNHLPYDGAASLYDPAINIPLGTQFLADLTLRFNGSPWLASAAYNAGPANAQRWVDARGNLDPETFILTIPFNETRDYVTRVLSFATIYGWRLHGEPVPVSTRLPAIGTPYDPPVDPKRKPVVCNVSTVPADSSGMPSSSASAGSVSP